MDKMREVIAQKVRPVLAAHNGDIELVEITSDGFVKVRLTGACATCPGAQQTMSAVVEETLKEEKAADSLLTDIAEHSVNWQALEQEGSGLAAHGPRTKK